MTFDDDFIRIHLSLGTHDIPLVAIGFEWPPPERIAIDWQVDGGVREARGDDLSRIIMERRSYSIITDEQRAEMTNVARGAEYRYL